MGLLRYLVKNTRGPLPFVSVSSYASYSECVVYTSKKRKGWDHPEGHSPQGTSRARGVAAFFLRVSGQNSLSNPDISKRNFPRFWLRGETRIGSCDRVSLGAYMHVWVDKNDDMNTLDFDKVGHAVLGPQYQ